MIGKIVSFVAFLPAYIGVIEYGAYKLRGTEEGRSFLPLYRRALYLGVLSICIVALALPSLNYEGWWLSIMVSLYATLDNCQIADFAVPSRRCMF
jgi:hypothetical protein